MARNLMNYTNCICHPSRAASNIAKWRNDNIFKTTSSHALMTRRPISDVTTARTDAPQKFDCLADSVLYDKKQKDRLQRIVKKHLSHIDGSYKIAQHVEHTLAKNRFEEALLLTQQASKDKQVVVAWNHLIAYELDNQRLKNAIRLYNDMKKRGQSPNVQTFTIIFRGCARSQHPKSAVAEAVKHYNILLNDRRLQPNSIHLNAVLSVCARAGDLDSMFLIADTANDSSISPTSYTYTTIFNALRHHALKEVAGLSDEQRMINSQKAVDRAKNLWVEVAEKWKQGRMLIDEELVCSMGRVLLVAPKREDKRHVLDLIQQTMNITNMAASTTLADADEIFVAKDSTLANKAGYVTPGRNTLAMLLTSLAATKLTKCGMKYWEIMVNGHGVVPDRDNWLRLFGMLKVAKASAQASVMINELPNEFVGEKPYRMAMETCVRDNINPKVMDHATTILELMLKKMELPDLHTLRLYLRVALVSHFHLRARAKSGDEMAAKREYGTQIMTALRRSWEPYKRLYFQFFKAASLSTDQTESGAMYNNKREVIALARLMLSALNKVVREDMLPTEDLRNLRRLSAKINREVQVFYTNRDELEPNLRLCPEQLNSESTSERENLSLRQGGDFVWDTTTIQELH